MAAELHTGVDSLRLRVIALMHHEVNIRNHTDDIILISVIKLLGFFQTGSHQNLRTSPFAEQLLLLIERISEGGMILLQKQFIQHGKVSGIVANRILHEQDGTHFALKNIVLCVELIFQQFDDGDNEVRLIVPAEIIIHRLLVLLVLDAFIHLSGEVGEQNERAVRHQLFHLSRKIKDARGCSIIHSYHRVVMMPILHEFERLFRRLCTADSRRVAQVKLEVFLRNLLFDATIFFKRKLVVVVAHQ